MLQRAKSSCKILINACWRKEKFGDFAKKNWKSSLKVDTIDIKNSNLIHTSFLFNYDYFYHITNISFQIENRYTSVLNLFSIFFVLFFSIRPKLCVTYKFILLQDSTLFSLRPSEFRIRWPAHGPNHPTQARVTEVQLQ